MFMDLNDSQTYQKTLEAKEKRKAYEQTQKAIARRKAYRQTPEYKAKQKAYQQTPEYKAKQKAYQQTPEAMAIRKVSGKAYYERIKNTPEYIAKRKAYQQTPEYIAKRKASSKAYYQMPEIKARRRKRYQTPEYKLYHKVYYKKYKDKVDKRKKEWDNKNKNKRREHLLKKYYQIDKRDFDNILHSQNNKCAICFNILTKPCVDHCHTSSEIRGILCNNCNTALGLFKDNVKNLESAIRYLNRYSINNPLMITVPMQKINI